MTAAVAAAAVTGALLVHDSQPGAAARPAATTSAVLSPACQVAVPAVRSVLAAVPGMRTEPGSTAALMNAAIRSASDTIASGGTPRAHTQPGRIWLQLGLMRVSVVLYEQSVRLRSPSPSGLVSGGRDILRECRA